MNKTTIEWTDYSWNPITGCTNGCSYCYARSNYSRFREQNERRPHKIINKNQKEPFDSKFWEYRLKDKMPTKPSKIFVGSMAGMFESKIPNAIIEKVIQVARNNPKHTFQFLTKNPKRYLDFEFPENCWLGATVDYPSQERIDWLKKKNNYKFISFEPLLGDMSGLDLSGIDSVIVGAMTGPRVAAPQEKWIKSIKHQNIFYKNNIKKYLCNSQINNSPNL